MVSQSTQDFVFSVLDAQQEYNTKLILFFVLLVMFSLMFWYSFRLIPNLKDTFSYPLSTVLFAMTMRILPLIFVPLFPLWFTVFMYREIALEVVMRYLFFSYGIAFLLMGIYGFIFGYGKLLDLFGLNLLNRKNRKRIKRFKR